MKIYLQELVLWKGNKMSLSIKKYEQTIINKYLYKFIGLEQSLINNRSWTENHWLNTVEVKFPITDLECPLICFIKSELSSLGFIQFIRLLNCILFQQIIIGGYILKAFTLISI